MANTTRMNVSKDSVRARAHVSGGLQERLKLEDGGVLAVRCASTL